MTELKEQIEEVCRTAPEEVRWGVSVVDINTSTEITGIGSHGIFEATSVNKLAIAWALGRTSLSEEQKIALQQSDRRPGAGVLRYFPAGYSLEMGVITRKMLEESDNTAARMLVRAIGGPLAVNSILSRASSDGSALLDTQLKPIGSDDTSPEAPYEYGQTTSYEAALLLLRLLQSGRQSVFDGLTHGSFNYGLRSNIEQHQSNAQVPPAVLGRFIVKVARGYAPRAVYEHVLRAQWPETEHPNKEGSYGSARHDVARIGKHVVAVLSEGWSERLSIGPNHPAHRVQAEIGSIVLAHSQQE
jgi:beta-lactamase class A